MSPPASLAGKLLELLACFHRSSLDVPDGLIARECVFRLNGTDYEATLGRPLSDPIVRLLGRGAGAYRLLAQALRYAMPDVTIQLEDLQGQERDGLVTGQATLTGTPRGGREPFVASVDVALVTDTRGRLMEVGVQVGEDLRRTLAGPSG
jgi:hypothetical protein